MIMTDTPRESHETKRVEIGQHIAEFLKSGGCITQCAWWETAVPENLDWSKRKAVQFEAARQRLQRKRNKKRNSKT